MNVCKNCNKSFARKFCLDRHINSNACKENNENSKTCEFCDKTLSSKQRLLSHIDICKKNNKNNGSGETKKNAYHEEIQELRKEINQLKEKPVTTTIINNTNTDNSVKTINQHNYSSLLDCTTESVTETFRKHYKTVQHLLESDQKQLANITVEHLLSGKDQPMYFVTDRSRNKFMFTDRENNEKEDANANLLRKLVYKGLKPIISNLYEKQLLKLNDDLTRYLRKDDGGLIACARDEIKELEESYKNANILKEGEDYIVQLSKCLPTSIKDRIYHDSLGLESDDEDSELEFQLKLKKKMRMIGNYTANELKDYKRQFMENREVYLPKEIVSDPKQYREVMAFFREADD